jgi:pyruvate/2-oxoglutarate dehydrogenase complex dihydrolipoamide dehydrogenase (E3) component
MKKDFDAIVIGTGQSGPFLAARMAAAGQRVAIIERHRFGGTRVNTGCIPTKTLVASASNARMVRRAADFGLQVPGTVRVDMKRVKARRKKSAGNPEAAWSRGSRARPTARSIKATPDLNRRRKL